MREISTNIIKETVKSACLELAYVMNEDVKRSLQEKLKSEKSPLGKNVIELLIENAEIAECGDYPLCQDTGMVVVNVEIGQDVKLIGEYIGDEINQGVREAYEEGFLRKSITKDPILRGNTGDNTPALISYEIATGEEIKLSIMLKGFGSENAGKIIMLKPADGVDEIINFVLKSVIEAGGKACPPFIVGVGIGGNLEKAASLAKNALFREIGERSKKAHICDLENKLLKLINETDIGPMGFHGTTTALDVFIETFPTHIVGLPVSVNLSCHSLRRKTFVI